MVYRSRQRRGIVVLAVAAFSYLMVLRGLEKEALSDRSDLGTPRTKSENPAARKRAARTARRDGRMTGNLLACSEMSPSGVREMVRFRSSSATRRSASHDGFDACF